MLETGKNARGMEDVTAEGRKVAKEGANTSIPERRPRT